MNKINAREREYLSAMKPFLKPEVDDQHVLNVIRIIESRGMRQGREGFTQDINWNDKDLL